MDIIALTFISLLFFLDLFYFKIILILSNDSMLLWQPNFPIHQIVLILSEWLDGVSCYHPGVKYVFDTGEFLLYSLI